MEKRPRPVFCELCKRVVPILSYHHWDDDKPSNGVWVCGKCHWIVEIVEKGFDVVNIIYEYKALKNEIELIARLRGEKISA